MDKIVFNVNELADYLKVSQSTIRKLIREKAEQKHTKVTPR